MLKISREEIEAAKKAKERITSQLNKSIGIALVILLAVSITGILLFKKWLLILILTIVFSCVILAYIPYAALYFIRKKQYGKKTKSILKCIKKYDKLYNLQSSEICSNRFLAHLNTYINDEKDPFALFSLRLIRYFAYLNRCENEAAYKELQDIEKSFDEQIHYKSDIVFARLDYAEHFDDNEYFRQLINENYELLENEKKEYQYALSYSLLTVHEKRINGDFKGAVKQIELNEEYLLKELNSPKYKYNIESKNRAIFKYACILLDKAMLLLNAEDEKKSEAVLQRSYEYIQQLSCDIPEIYVQSYRKLSNRLCSDDGSVLPQTLD